MQKKNEHFQGTIWCSLLSLSLSLAQIEIHFEHSDEPHKIYMYAVYRDAKKKIKNIYQFSCHVCKMIESWLAPSIWSLLQCNVITIFPRVTPSLFFSRVTLNSVCVCVCVFERWAACILRALQWLPTNHLFMHFVIAAHSRYRFSHHLWPFFVFTFPSLFIKQRALCVRL